MIKCSYNIINKVDFMSREKSGGREAGDFISPLPGFSGEVSGPG